MMNIPLILTLHFLVFSTPNAETIQVRESLVEFMQNLSPGTIQNDPNWGWNMTSDPCIHRWRGVTCYSDSPTVRKIVLDDFNLTGSVDAAALCASKALAVISLNSNYLVGTLPEELSECTRLTHIYLHGNNFSGNIPASLSKLGNLKRIDVSDNAFSGGIPDLSGISRLLTFLADNNHLSGGIPRFNFSNLEEFNVSSNVLAGPIPDVGARFNEASFLGNPGLCGKPLFKACPDPSPPPARKKSSSNKDYLIYSGYTLIGLIIVCLIALKLMKKRVPAAMSDSKVSGSSSEYSISKANRSEFSVTSAESGRGSASLTVLSSPVVDGMKFEELLRAPAELIGRGRYGSLYKVRMNEGVSVAVKRIREWDISRDDFKKRMGRLDEVRHPNVMPIIAFYCSRQEKLLVYEFQHNGSLFNLLHGSQNGQTFDWGSRLTVAAKISSALAVMHERLQADGIAHGNLKSSNILLNKDLEPLISEYGLAEVENQDESLLAGIDSFQEHNTGFQTDTYRFGIILLELLTGKLVQNNGLELARWVNSAIREEWTVEVFDKSLVAEGVSEERLVHLLQVALKCINGSSQVRPAIGEVAGMIQSIREVDERSVSSES